jgi:hypothetical protein
MTGGVHRLVRAGGRWSLVRTGAALKAAGTAVKIQSLMLTLQVDHYAQRRRLCRCKQKVLSNDYNATKHQV